MPQEITPRQQEILDLLDKGMKVRAIGEKLGITRNAVYQQIEALKKKGIVERTYTPSGEIRTIPGREHMLPSDTPAHMLSIIESQQRTIEQQAQTCAQLAAQLTGIQKL